MITEFSFKSKFNAAIEIVMADYEMISFKVTIYLGSIGYVAHLNHLSDDEICQLIFETEIHEHLHRVLAHLTIALTKNEQEFIVDFLMRMIDMDFSAKYSKG